MTIYERLQHAKDRIQTVGWHHGSWSKSGTSGPGCLLRSMLTDEEFEARCGEYSFEVRTVQDPMLNEAAQLLGFGETTYGGPRQNAARWNDELGRTEEEVLARLDAVLNPPPIPIQKKEFALVNA